MILNIMVKEITFRNGIFIIYVLRNVIYYLITLTLTLKILLENALRFEADVVLNILPCSTDFTCVDRPTMQEV